jgi:hypothetical protein
MWNSLFSVHMMPLSYKKWGGGAYAHPSLYQEVFGINWYNFVGKILLIIEILNLEMHAFCSQLP